MTFLKRLVVHLTARKEWCEMQAAYKARRNVASLLAQRINSLSPSQLKKINEIVEQ